MTPALALGALFVLIGAQAAHLLTRRLPYLVALPLSAAGVIGAEVVVAALRFGGPSVGVLHPVADVIGVAVCEGAGAALTGGRRRAA